MQVTVDPHNRFPAARINTSAKYDARYVKISTQVLLPQLPQGNYSAEPQRALSKMYSASSVR